MITIIDYEAGNLRSVAKAFEAAGEIPEITCNAERILNSDAVVLPGVGAFENCMSSLVKKGMDQVVKDCIKMSRPFLGICLGYQMLFESSEEHPEGSPDVPGLGIFEGKVRKFSNCPGLKVPHMGWNDLSFPKSSPLFYGLPQGACFYFVHSYYVDAKNKSLVAAQAEYGLTFDAAIAKDNVFAVQFHPEKSGAVGLALIKNFLRVVKGK